MRRRLYHRTGIIAVVGLWTVIALGGAQLFQDATRGGSVCLFAAYCATAFLGLGFTWLWILSGAGQ